VDVRLGLVVQRQPTATRPGLPRAARVFGHQLGDRLALGNRREHAGVDDEKATRSGSCPTAPTPARRGASSSTTARCWRRSSDPLANHNPLPCQAPRRSAPGAPGRAGRSWSTPLAEHGAG
jgi:hypothetical protein